MIRSTAVSILFLLVSCSGGRNVNDRPVVTVTLPPQAYFVEAVAGDRVVVNVMVPPGASPATYEPSMSQLGRLSQSSLYFRIGYVGFELTWMDKIRSVNPSMKIADLTEGMDLLREAGEGHVHGPAAVRGKQGNTNRDPDSDRENPGDGHGHPVPDRENPGDGHRDPDSDRENPGDGHGHPVHEKGIDPHVWMSVSNARVMAEHIHRELLLMLPSEADELNVRYAALRDDLDSLDRVLKQKLEGIENRTFMIYHPALTYFARDYNLVQLPIETEGKSPSPAHMKELVDAGEERDIRTIFIQKQFDQRNAETLAKEIGAELVEIDPLDRDWKKQMLHVAEELIRSLQ